MWPQLVSFQLIILMASLDMRRCRRRRRLSRGQQAENRVCLRRCRRLEIESTWPPSKEVPIHQVLDDVSASACMTIFVLRVR